MALGDSYASVAELEARLGATDDGTFTALLDSASRAVETFTGRQFNKTDTATARRFRAVDPRRLPVDDFHTITDLAVNVNGAAWDIVGVDPRPPDGVVNGQTGWPYSDLMTISRYWPNSRRATVEVTARWGWAAVPSAIKQATLDAAVALSTGAGTSGGIVQESIGDYSVTYGSASSVAGSVDAPAEMAKAVPYRRKRFGVA